MMTFLVALVVTLVAANKLMMARLYIYVASQEYFSKKLLILPILGYNSEWLKNITC